MEVFSNRINLHRTGGGEGGGSDELGSGSGKNHQTNAAMTTKSRIEAHGMTLRILEGSAAPQFRQRVRPRGPLNAGLFAHSVELHLYLAISIFAIRGKQRNAKPKVQIPR
jgi:hypothetical protein